MPLQCGLQSLKRDMIALEIVQRHATKLAESIAPLSYSDRLRNLGQVRITKSRLLMGKGGCYASIQNTPRNDYLDKSKLFTHSEYICNIWPLIKTVQEKVKTKNIR